MAITTLSLPGGEMRMGNRDWWMPVFEGYFSCAIKFVNPCFLCFMIAENLAADLEEPYAG